MAIKAQTLRVANPNKSRITDPMWWMWLRSDEVFSSARLGGFYAVKPGYHNVRNNLPSSDYSVRRPEDKLGPGDKSAGFDLSLNAAEMKIATARLEKAAKDVNDPRARYMAEFIGTKDGRRVYCRVITGQGKGFDDWGRDETHLWHVHISIMRKYIADWTAIDAIVSILVGESLDSYKKRTNPAVVISYDLVTVPADTTWGYLGKVYFGTYGGGAKILAADNGKTFNDALINTAIPAGTTIRVRKPHFLVHFVGKGETMTGIAKLFKRDLKSIKTFNPDIKNPDVLKIGTPLRVSALSY